MCQKRIQAELQAASTCVVDDIIQHAATLTATEVSGQRLGKGHALTIPRAPATKSKLNANLAAAHKRVQADRKARLKEDARSEAVSNSSTQHAGSRSLSSISTSTKTRAKKILVVVCTIYLKGIIFPQSKKPIEVSSCISDLSHYSITLITDS